MGFDCSKCPIYESCLLAYLEVVGVPLAGRTDISSYEDCPIYKRCRDAEDVKECIAIEIEPEFNDYFEEYLEE